MIPAIVSRHDVHLSVGKSIVFAIFFISRSPCRTLID